MCDISTFLEHLTAWTVTQSDIFAVLLVGSYARSAARTDSDMDIVMITSTPQHYLQNDTWLSNFGQVTQVQDEDWGLVQSRRVFYADGLEVEFGITTPQWANTDPVDDGTRRVISDGARVVYDPGGILASLIQLISGKTS
jgi:hypothetical protein